MFLNDCKVGQNTSGTNIYFFNFLNCFSFFLRVAMLNLLLSKGLANANQGSCLTFIIILSTTKKI